CARDNSNFAVLYRFDVW
nr:immunoglobulin heavy chain junction region [Macaca mulatta]MOW95698.1 immunoglobulin heavy chain junction region [Macaca mulatta]MOW95712.1 immunoglobulin heavy chain junction region [Macaca mulatta]MOW96091.1 immunoglobulin heavy chain junction region [Macaca mulatta]MOW96609.1 immunoglobulin heavy chain junction region [Macaca mulatta]